MGFTVLFLRLFYDGEESDTQPRALVIGNYGFFNSRTVGDARTSEDAVRHEIARFLARYPDCRAPVEVPYGILLEMERWTGAMESSRTGPRAPDWSAPIEEWRRLRRWGLNLTTPLTPNQRAALDGISQYLLKGHLRSKGSVAHDSGVRLSPVQMEIARRVADAERGRGR